MYLSKWISATLAIALMAGSAAATDTVASGKVKSINSASKTFVFTDTADKDFTFKLGDKMIVNRAGKESASDLKVGDVVDVCYDSGLLSYTTHYVLVKEGASKGCGLIRGHVKSYNPDKNELTFTSEYKKDATYPMGKAVVRFNMENAKIENIKIGDNALLIVDMESGKAILQSVMVDRAK